MGFPSNKPSTFHRNAQQSPQAGKKPFAPKPSDHLVTIHAYDFANSSITGMNHMGQVATYTINREAIARCSKTSFTGGAKFMGHLIDEKMAYVMPVGRRIVLEKAVYANKAQDGSKFYEANRVINSTAQDEDKLFTGLFTATKYNERISGVQSWKKQAVAAKADTLTAVAEEFDATYAEFEAGKRVSLRGFQIRALKKDPAGTGWMCFDSTEPYDYQPAVRDAEGNITEKMTPISKARFVEICKGYKAYVLGQFPNFKADGCVLDVMSYVSYKASDMSGAMALGSEWSALSKITARNSMISTDGDSYNGRNTAANGIVELTDDKVSIVNKQAVIEVRNIVQKLHVNNYMGDVREMVLAFDGEKVRLDDSIRVALPGFVKLSDPQEEPAAEQTSSIEAMFDQTPPAAQPFELEEDPFGLD